MKLELVLVILTGILMGSLAANTFLYAQQYSLTNNGLQKQVNELESQVANLQDEKVNLQNQLHSRLNQTQTPMLVTRLGTDDVRGPRYVNHPWGRIRFYVSGEVWNVGSVAANNSKLHVILYQFILYQGNTKANDTYVELGKIEAGSFVDVAANINYEGDALTSWTITPEYS
jgi:hypothetical protein